MGSRFSRLLPATLWTIAVVQFVLGTAFLIAPERASHTLGLSVAPGWTNWLFGMMAARFLGFGYGMVAAARDPQRARPWIKAMIGIQALDWLVTLKYLFAGAVTLAQVSTASFLPVLFVAVLVTGIRAQPGRPSFPLPSPPFASLWKSWAHLRRASSSRQSMARSTKKRCAPSTGELSPNSSCVNSPVA